jgi:hypothetical protein
MQPRVPSEAVHQTCSPLFIESPVKGNQREFTYSTQNDFGRVIHDLLFCSPSQGFSRCFFANISEIGALEGFSVQPSEQKYSSYCVRDPKLATADCHVLEPTCSSQLGTALERMGKLMHYKKDHVAVLTEHPSLKGAVIGVVARDKMHRRTADGLASGVQRDSRIYFEGGNCFRLTDRTGTPRYLIGRDQAIATHQRLRLDKWFNDWYDPSQPDRKNGACWDETLLHSKCDTNVNKWFLGRKIPGIIQERAAKLSKTMDDAAVLAVLNEMKAMGLLSVLVFKTPQQKTDGREIATKYLAQLQFVKTEIFPAELCCKAEEISYVPQAAYHLDLMMAPGPKGSVFVQDYDLAVQLLQKLLENAKALELSDTDVQQLHSFIATTSTLRNDLKPLLAEVKAELIKAGFTVIPTPGAFFGLNDKKEPLNINFLNCLTGFSPKTGHYFYIASGAQTNGRLGEVLMDAYAEFLTSHCSNTVVYFAGRDPTNERDFSEAMEDLNRTKSQLGPHCLSYELKIAPHTEKNEINREAHAIAERLSEET